MTRYLGIDYGTKQIGLAVSDTGGTLAAPLRTIRASRNLQQDIRLILQGSREYDDVEAFVVGLPLHMDGTAGVQAKLTREFANELGRVTGKPIHLWDERLSSRTADELLREHGVTRKKRKAHQDRVAAQVILQEFLDARANPPPGGTGLDER